MGYVSRPQHIVVDYITENGSAESIELKGFLATVFQHELDHLKGKLYIDSIEDLNLFSYEEEYLNFHQEEESPELE